MIFRAIRLNNYGIYAGMQEIEPASGAHALGNITLIGGINGRGKTSLLDSVLLAFYGSRSPSVKEYKKGYSAYLESLVHRGIRPGEDSSVELDLVVPQNSGATSLRVRRSWRLASKRYTDQLDVWRDGIADPTLADNWDVYVEELLPVGLAGLFFFDGEKIAQLAEADETESGLRQSIRALLGLDLVDRLIADLNTVVRRNQAEIRDKASREEYDRLEAEWQRLAGEAERKRQEIAAVNSRILRHEALHQEKETAFYEEGGRLSESREELRNQENELRTRIGEERTEAAQMAAGALPLLLVHPLLQQIEATVLQEKGAADARSALQLLSERDERLLAHLSSLAADSGLAGELAHWLNADRNQLADLASRPVRFSLGPIGINQLHQLLHGGAERHRQEARELRQLAEQTTKEFEHVRDHLAIEVDQDTVQSILKEIAEAARTVSDLQQQKEGLYRELTAQVQQMEQIRRRRAEIGESLGDVEEAERIIRYATITQEKMALLGERATLKKVDKLTKAVKEAFDTLTHKTTLVHTIHMDPETLRISLLDEGGSEIPKARLSSGEKQMLAIAILWGLGRASGRSLPIIIDTPLGRLDSSHRMNFVRKYLPNASHQVLVLSTDTEIVGPYLEALQPSIGRYYLLDYLETEGRTEVRDGYFTTVGGTAE